MSAAVDRLIRYAEQRVRAGQRPTVDLLVAECGGSRTTAQKALNTFWEDALPRLLEARSIEDTEIPPPVIEAIRRLWGEAQTLAGEHAAAAVQAEREAVKTAQATAEARVAEAAALVEDAKREAAAVGDRLAEREAAQAEDQIRIADLMAKLDAERETRSAAQAESERLRAERDGLNERLASMTADLARLREERDQYAAAHAAEIEALRVRHAEALEAQQRQAAQAQAAIQAAHQRAFDELREGRLAAEQRLMVEIDSAKTVARKYEKTAALWQQRHAATDTRLREAERRLSGQHKVRSR